MARVLFLILQIAFYAYIRLMQAINYMLNAAEFLCAAMLWPIRRLRD